METIVITTWATAALLALVALPVATSAKDAARPRPRHVAVTANDPTHPLVRPRRSRRG